MERKKFNFDKFFFGCHFFYYLFTIAFKSVITDVSLFDGVMIENVEFSD